MTDSELRNDIISMYELGMDPEQIKYILGITDEHFERFNTEKNVKAAREHGIARTNFRVIKALLDAACGHVTETVTTERRFGRDGRTVVSRTTTSQKKENTPNLAAIRIWLDNKDSNWKDAIEDAERKLDISISVDGKTINVKNKEINLDGTESTSE